MVLFGVGAFPVFKLGLLAFRQMIRPLTKKVIDHGKENSSFRKYVLCSSAQTYNRLEVILRLRSLDLKAPFKVPSLPEEEAARLGADLVSELMVFGLFVTVAVFEYNRQLLMEAFKTERIQKEKQEILEQVKYLNTKTAEHGKIIDELQKTVQKLSSIAKAASEE